MGGDLSEYESNGHAPRERAPTEDVSRFVVEEHHLIDDAVWRRMLRRAFGTAGELDDE